MWNTTNIGETLEEFQQRVEAETTFNLEVENGLQWKEGDVEISMEKEYE